MPKKKSVGSGNSSKARRAVQKYAFQARTSQLARFLATRSLASFAVAGVCVGLVCWTFMSFTPASSTRLRKRDLSSARGGSAFDAAAQGEQVDLPSLRNGGDELQNASPMDSNKVGDNVASLNSLNSSQGEGKSPAYEQTDLDKLAQQEIEYDEVTMTTRPITKPSNSTTKKPDYNNISQKDLESRLMGELTGDDKDYIKKLLSHGSVGDDTVKDKGKTPEEQETERDRQFKEAFGSEPFDREGQMKLLEQQRARYLEEQKFNMMQMNEQANNMQRQLMAANPVAAQMYAQQQAMARNVQAQQQMILQQQRQMH